MILIKFILVVNININIDVDTEYSRVFDS